ncbi:cofactor-independent phosphoglycerate mutase [Thermoclostridium stercorarium]|jgi:2,3-bisphosphoglycerate-independent phosphoglycerate mutase|uniref:Phosphoglycerate mutase n=1 Tax=Thermoclostridium stercorarium subsp. leptospartum DSM 9219 TaxID=1346611 RepID=A0A1B1YIM0_THEST|nr:cofactor-independent phosphoglycerate mutase [Thermoclostridium stercorarium]ANX00611.1 phosphoglycerate mutase [Thermoclostridium stercorarium subsp. leptospartum DSM 9219]UZQ86222.1 cofactor-independent phosphoglycerate mutase [Thermoclostridium stercorarium]
MKYVVVIGDGMADYPVPELHNRTPLEAARKPNMDYLAKNGEMGLVKTVPDGLQPGSDVANLSVFGYDPKLYYTGRSPLEAVSMGVSLGENDVAVRCNLVTLSDEEKYEDKTMIDYSAGEITTIEARELIKAISEKLNSDEFSFYPGISYRHCLVWKNGNLNLNLTPPHDISGKKIGDYLPKGEGGELLLSLMKESTKILKNHPINRERIRKGLNPATSIWLWGQGKKPSLETFYDKFKLSGSVISAVDLVRGIGMIAGLKPVYVEGATGNLHTNYRGKAMAALEELESGRDFVYIHVEAPDECGHQGLAESKVKAIELIDSELLGPLLQGLSKWDYSLLLLPDHPTPLSTRTHSGDPVPYVLYRKNKPMKNNYECYSEKSAALTGIFVEKGHTLIEKLINS